MAVVACFSTPAFSQKARTGPVTPNLVTLTISLAQRQAATIMVHEGELGRFGDGHKSYGVVARTQPEGDALTVRVFEIINFDGGGEGLVQLSRSSLHQGERADIAAPKMSIVIDDIKRTVPYQPVGEGPSVDDDCCVFCSDIWACGLCVRLDCGCCCDPGYCHPRCSENCPRPPQ